MKNNVFYFYTMAETFYKNHRIQIILVNDNKLF